MGKIVDNEIELKDIIRDSILIEVDFQVIEDLDSFIGVIYNGLKCPPDFGKNLNAFFDTINDTQYWVKKPLILTFKNFKELNNNIDFRMLISDISIELIQIESHYHIIVIKE